MKKISFVCLMLSMLMAVPVSAQKKVSVDLSGFVAVQSCYDSRVSNQVAGDLLYLYPQDKKMVSGQDVNDRSHTVWFGNMVRFIAKIKGPEIFGAASRALAELEVSGANGSILYRHAYIALDWDKSTLTLGQTWHPMNELFPNTVDISIGAPFNALNRSPMLKYDYFFGDNKDLKLTGAAIFQTLYCSNGPLAAGRSPEYAKNSGVPELWLGAEQTIGDLKLSVGGEFQRIAPVFNGKDKKYLNSFDGMFQAQYAHDKFAAKGKVMCGQNMSHLGLPTGYGLASDSVSYSPLKAVSSWVFFSYGGALKGCIMGGYMKNLGADKELIEIYSDKNLDSMFRIAPSIQYSVGNLNLGLEFDVTTVAYGKVQPKGNVTDAHNVTNNRILLSAMYSF